MVAISEASKALVPADRFQKLARVFKYYLFLQPRFSEYSVIYVL